MSGGFGEAFGFPFYEGSGQSTLAPYVFPISLGDYAYNLDLSFAPENFKYGSVPTQRDQQDLTAVPGEQSLSSLALWRRSTDSWHLGAGQDVLDRPDISVPYRFRSSLGMNVWDRYKLSLLPDVDEKRNSVSTNLYSVVVGDYLYISDGINILRTQSITVDTPVFTAVSGLPGSQVGSIATDGFNVMATFGASGIYKTTRGAVSFASHITGTVGKIAYARGRWIALNANSIYDVTSQVYGAGPVALTSPLFSHANSDFAWKDVAEGAGFIYLAGYSGTRSFIYRTAVNQDATALTAPVNAIELPEGELVESIFGYLGRFLAIGTNRGWRLGFIQADGELRLGVLRRTPLTVKAFEGEESFIWFGYTNYDSTHTGLGRMSLTDFVDVEALQPAFATDLMVNGQGEVQSIVTFQGIRFFSVSADGFYAEHHAGNRVPCGTLETGAILFNLNEDKIGLFFDVTMEEHTGEPTHSIAVSLDGADFIDLGTHTDHTMPFLLGEARARSFEFRITLCRDSLDLTLSQILLSWLFRSQPAPSVSTIWTVPLLISDKVEDLFGNPHEADPFAQLDNIVSLQRSKGTTTLQMGSRVYPVVVEEFDNNFHHLVEDTEGLVGYNGTCIVQCKVLSLEE